MDVQRAFFLRGLLLLLFLLTLAGSAESATTIGLYTDESGSSCSFSGNNSGVVTAYVIVRPDGDGVRGVRFAAPAPACFNATWLGDATTDGVVSIGDSQSGISLAMQDCGLIPQNMMRIYYFHNGGTTPCCAFPIVADPGSGAIEVATCNFGTADGTPVTSHMNADATCPCNDDVAPMTPTGPTPADGVVNLIEWPSFLWTCQDWDGDLSSFDVYLGTTTNPPLVATVSSPSYELSGPLTPFTTYRWRVVARDAQGHQTAGPLWTFTIGKHNNPPSITLIEPSNDSYGIELTQGLFWTSSDPDGNVPVFDVYFGTANPPAFVTTRSLTFYAPPLNEGTTYYWRVVARDAPHSETSSPVWSFHTRILNPPPDEPSAPSPGHSALNVPLDADLSWNGIDPELEAVHCVVQFGTNPNAIPVVTTNVIPGEGHRATFDPGPLANAQVYYWRVTVVDARGASTAGPVWGFSTGANRPPNIPTLLSPPDGAVNQPFDVTLSWSDTDPDPGQQLWYDVYAGTTSPPPQAFSFLQASSVIFHAEQGSTKFYWKVVARDVWGLRTSSLEHSFTTKPLGTNNPPTVPSNPNPTDGAVVSVGGSGLNLQWTSTDPDGNAMSFIVFFGTTNPPPFLGVSNQTSYAIAAVVQGPQYFWQVIAGDGISSTPGPLWRFTVTNPLPVLFSRFDAGVSGTAVRVRWKLDSDEAMSTYTVLRRAKGASQFISTASAAVNAATGEYIDRTVEGGKSYDYQLLIRTMDGADFRSQIATVDMPVLELALGRNHPNPFNPQTTIPYTVPPGSAPVHVRLAIYDTVGRLVRVLVDDKQGGGARETVWNGNDTSGSTVSSGVYLCVLQVGKQRLTQKLVLLK